MSIRPFGCDMCALDALLGVDSKRRAFWSLNEDILKITVLKTNTPYPSRKIRCIRACIHQRPQKIKDQYAISRGLNTPYSRYGINIIFWKISNVANTLRIPDGKAAQTTIPNTTAFQTKDLDAYDFNCDDVSNAKAVLMANLSNYGSNVISEVPHFKPYHTDIDNQSVHTMQGFEQTPVANFTDIEITSYSNIISYSQYLQEMQQASVQDTNFQHVASPVFDDEETLILEEVSRSKMLAKQNDLISKETKVNTTPTNYVELNRLSKGSGKCFVSQQELFDEQAFWLQTSHPNTDKSALSPVKIEAPRELPMVSMVNTSLKKLKYHLGLFDTLVKKRITPDTLIEGAWGFEHIKAVFLKEIIPFLKTLKVIFTVFDKDLLYEVTEVQTVFNQIEAVVQQYFVDKQYIMICVMNYIAVFDDVNVEMQSSKSCVKCVDLDAELLNKQNAYNDLSKSYSQLEKYCIFVELTMQRNQEIFQKDSLSNNQNALEILKYFENNDLKAQLQAKDTTICCPDCTLVSRLRMLKTYDRESLSTHELWLGHNLFSVGQFCDADLEVAFRKNTCFIQNLEGVDLLLGSRDINLYTISLDDIIKTSPICLLSKSSKTKSWLWHRQLSHLNFGTLNKLAKDDL
ncbi:retrovirus-related pol polyprotein from transposon TNT 1-94 [Tanacetum coccineum]